MDRFFPTYSGVCQGFPHRRGGGPLSLAFPAAMPTFSPQAWGWTANPESARAYRCRFPHRRGGGPQRRRFPCLTVTFSPQAWGWTEGWIRSGPETRVFPTGVGVDRITSGEFAVARSFPHRRGGGPSSFLAGPPSPAFSPQAWGWTVHLRLERRALLVFPTGVGVDRQSMIAAGLRNTFSPQAWGWAVN